jgi:aminoglycoside 3-N-acetyltransferase
MKLYSALKTSSFFSLLRALKYKSKRANLTSFKKISISDLRSVLVKNLAVEQGDSLIIHCGFGFLNASFSPEELIELLMSVVGPTGHIAMPYYPPGLSFDWAKAGRIFEVGVTRSSTGVVSDIFARYPGVVVSTHPVKALSIWGPKANELALDHDLSVYPFDKNSPYFKFSQLPSSKTLGLGVRNCSMVHCAEDMLLPDIENLYLPECFELQVKRDGVTKPVRTRIHRSDLKLMTSDQFYNVYCPNLPKVVNADNRFFYILNNKDLIKNLTAIFIQGNSRVQIS